jgi:hypothetical protein
LKRSSFAEGLVRMSPQEADELRAAWFAARAHWMVRDRLISAIGWLDRRAKLSNEHELTARWVRDAQEAQERREDRFDLPQDKAGMLLAVVFERAGLTIASTPTVIGLQEQCRQLEARAIEQLRTKTAPSRWARLRRSEELERFTGTTLDDLTRYIASMTFRNLEAAAEADEKLRERAAADLAASLAQLTPEARERIRQTAGLDSLAADELQRAGAIGALGFGVAGAINIGGFAVYTATTSAMATLSGAVGIGLPFTTFLAATSFVQFLAVWAAPISVGLMALGYCKLDRDMSRALLPPTVATTSLLAHRDAVPGHGIRDLAAHLEMRWREFSAADASRREQIARAYPCFRLPEEA